MSVAGEGRDYTITAVDRAITLLEQVAERPGSNVTDLANLTGFSRSLVFRLVHTLEKRGYLERSSNGRSYAVGCKSLLISTSAQDNSALMLAARPYLEELAARSGENVNLIIRDGLHHLTVFARRSPDPNTLYAKVGRRGPLHVGGAPKILLAFASQDVQDAVLSSGLKKYTPYTVTDPEELKAILMEIRRTGVNETTQDLDMNAFSFAGAVYRAGGEVVAAVSVAGPAKRLTNERTRLLRGLVLDTTANISAALGWHFEAQAVV